MFFYECGFEDKRLEHTIRFLPGDRLCTKYHIYDMRTTGFDEVTRKIARHTGTERRRFADIQYLASLSEKITARSIRKIEFFELLTIHILDSSISINPPQIIQLTFKMFHFENNSYHSISPCSFGLADQIPSLSNTISWKKNIGNLGIPAYRNK